MLQSLSIKNYALIDEITLEFAKELSIITGETGAGKSIMLGAIQLLLGGRADRNLLSDPTKKCMVEAIYDKYPTHLDDLIKKYDLDEFDGQLLMRREVSPNGKSRAFINDTPVTLGIVKEFANELIDLNRQHELLEVQSINFHYELIDSIAGVSPQIENYRSLFNQRKLLIKEHQAMIDQLAKATQEKNYIQFQYDEVEGLAIQENEYTEVESTIGVLENYQEIKSLLQTSQDQLVSSDTSLEDIIRSLRNQWSEMAAIDPVYNTIAERFTSLSEEVIDLAAEISGVDIEVESDVSLDELKERRDLIANLLLKHQLQDINALDALVATWKVTLGQSESLQEQIDQHQVQIAKLDKALRDNATKISKKRKAHFGKLENSVNRLLSDLNMEHANIQVAHRVSDNCTIHGLDEIEILFSSNKGMEMRSIKDVASGGELSRLMLCMKTTGAESMALPTLIFDEIDTGVSGEVAHKMGVMLKDIASHHQVIVITHSPQVAAKADKHFEVYKDSSGQRASTHVSVLESQDRVVAIAKMLSGEKPTDIALKNAEELLVSK